MFLISDDTAENLSHTAGGLVSHHEPEKEFFVLTTLQAIHNNLVLPAKLILVIISTACCCQSHVTDRTVKIEFLQQNSVNVR